jgi:alkanesulfonate monooxygenase SsuD/methylene tetrahydromethanopterin reductase-like flavin-dependent oxidoreductase (luciferase family)
MKRGVFIAPFDELADPLALAELGALAEGRGWDGVFLWDHITYSDPIGAIADPWTVLAAIADRTDRIRLGPLVTPLPRRRPWVLARQAVTLDHLSGGRLVLGLGIGGDSTGEMKPFGEEASMRTRAAMLEEGMDLLAELMSGEPVDHAGPHYEVHARPFLPRPLQTPRIPVWIGACWPARKPFVRAAQWDGVFPIEIEPGQIAEMNALIAANRPPGAGRFEVVAEMSPGESPAPWKAAGVDWLLTDLGPERDTGGGLAPPPSLASVRATIAAGPA